LDVESLVKHPIDVNYAFRDITAPGNDVAQDVLDYGGDLLSIQATLKF